MVLFVIRKKLSNPLIIPRIKLKDGMFAIPMSREFKKVAAMDNGKGAEQGTQAMIQAYLTVDH